MTGGGPGDRGEEPGEGGEVVPVHGDKVAGSRRPTTPGSLSAVTYSLLVLETIIVVSFGASWFVKGRKILFGG
jgi:hypothetical protein